MHFGGLCGHQVYKWFTDIHTSKKLRYIKIKIYHRFWREEPEEGVKRGKERGEEREDWGKEKTPAKQILLCSYDSCLTDQELIPNN